MALAGLLILIAGLALQPMEETDLFFRLATGDEILRSGALVRRNLFSFTYPDAPYFDSAWLFDLGVAGLYRAGGFPAIVLAKTAVLVATFALAYVVCRRHGAGRVASAVALATGALVMRDRFVERPHVITFLGEVALLGLLATRERAPRRLWLAVPLTALWANLHAGAFIAPVILLCGGGFLVALASAVALLLTPVGPGLFRYLAFHADIFALHPVDEFRPPTWTSDAPLLLYAAVAVALAVFVRPPPGEARGRWRDTLPAVALALLAARSVRFGADLALVAALLVAERLSWLARRLVPAAELWRTTAVSAVAGLALAACALFPRVAAARAGRPFVSLDLVEESLPLAAIKFAEDHDLTGRMYNDFELGGYLAWHWFPRHRVFVDGRLPAYPVEFHRLLGRADLSRADWDAAMARLGVDTALLGYAGVNRRVSFWDPVRWALVYREQDARVFVRRLPRYAALIAAREIPATFTFTAEAGTATVPLLEPPALSPVPSCEWQRRLGDLFFDLDTDLAVGRNDRALAATRAALAAPAGCLAGQAEAAASAWVGRVLLAAGATGEALVFLGRSLALVPDDVATLTNQALALEKLGRTADAGLVRARMAALGRRGPPSGRSQGP